MKSDSNAKEKPIFNNKKLLKVGILFFSLSVLLNFIVWYLGAKENLLEPINVFTAWITTATLHLSGLQAVRESNVIYLANDVWIMLFECTAVHIMIIYSSFIIVYPSSVKSKVTGLLLGVPFIFCANIFRLLIMAWIDKLKPSFSEYFHDYAWQAVFIFMVIIMWLLWIEKVEARETKVPVSP